MKIEQLEKEINKILGRKNRPTLAELRKLMPSIELENLEVKTGAVYDNRALPAYRICQEWDSLTIQEENMSDPEHCFNIGRVYNKFESLKSARKRDPHLVEIEAAARKLWNSKQLARKGEQTIFDVMYEKLMITTRISERAKVKLKELDCDTWPQKCNQWGMRERERKA